MKLILDGDDIRLLLDDVESGVLAALIDDLSAALDVLDDDDPVRRRLFPDGHREDAATAAEFRELTEAGLRQTKRDRAGLCRAELPDGEGELFIDEENHERWLTVLNDLRLAIGTRIGITEDDDDADDDDYAASGESAARNVYYWLTALQDSLVRAVL